MFIAEHLFRTVGTRSGLLGGVCREIKQTTRLIIKSIKIFIIVRFKDLVYVMVVLSIIAERLSARLMIAD